MFSLQASKISGLKYLLKFIDFFLVVAQVSSIFAKLQRIKPVSSLQRQLLY